SLEKEQELLLKVADIVSDIYSIESAILRTEKAINKNGTEKEALKLKYTAVFTEEAVNRIEQTAKESLIHMEEGDTLRTMLSMLRKLTRHNPIDVIALKREIAKEVL